MTPERWHEVERLYLATIELDLGERVGFLGRECAGDDSLRREVESLLAQASKAGGFMESSALAFAARQLASESPQPFVGRSLGPYTLLTFLGAGGMGEVYKARDTRLDRTVAIKVICADWADDPAHRRRFEREARAVAALSHPHICSLFDVGNDSGTDFLVMEYLEGDTLADVIDGQPMSPIRVLELCIQLADALETAHLQGVIHQDIKPANIFVTSRNDAKLLDFGVVRILGAPIGEVGPLQSSARGSGEMTAPIGTVGYMSPEQIRGEPVDGRTDLFSLGLVAYEMATGHHAFSGTASEIADGILSRDAPRVRQANPAVPADLDRIIAQALARNPDLRYQRAEDMRIDLEQCKRQMESAGSPQFERAASQRPSSAVKTWAILAACALAVTAGTYAIGNWRNRAVKQTTLQLVDVPISEASRVVVLPFENLTRLPADDWLAGAFSDSFTARLQSVPDAIVIGRERVIEFYGAEGVHEGGPLEPQLVKRLATLFNLRYYVHGDYQRVGDQIKVVARLVAVDSGEIRAHESITDAFVNVLQVQDTLARRFASAISAGSVAGSGLRDTQSLDAYQSFTEAQTLYVTRHLASAREKLEHTISIDRRYAKAWALLSKTYSRLGAPTGMKDGSQETYRNQASAAARRAIELEPNSYDAHVALALAYRGLTATDPWRAEAKRAVDLNPRGSEGYALLADYYSAMPMWGCRRDRDSSLAETYYNRAREIDPRLNTNFAAHLNWVGRLDDALRTVEDELSVVPENPTNRRVRGQSLLFKNRVVEAENEIRTVTDGGKNMTTADEWVLTTVELLRGKLDAAGQHFQRVIALSPTADSELLVGRSYFIANRLDLALPHLRRAIEIDPGCAEYLADSIPFKAALTDAPFRQFMADHGASVVQP